MSTISLLEFMTDDRYLSDWQYLRHRAVCADGFSISIQASPAHRCKLSQAENQPYESLELGFPSEKEPLILRYAEEKRYPMDTVYNYVPWKVVEKMLNKHSGIIGMGIGNNLSMAI